MIKRVYILPTIHGVAFLGLIVVMILVAAASGNNLVYGLAFTLFAVFMLVMINTNANLKGLEVEVADNQEAFARETSSLQLVLINNKGRSRFLIRGQARKIGVGDGDVTGEVQPGGRAIVQVPLRFETRGVFSHVQLNISTVYPLGLFRAWTSLNLKGPFFIYPERKGDANLPLKQQGQFQGEGRAEGMDSNPEDFREHSRYINGESQHRVDWKAYARHGEMLSKRYGQASPRHVVLDWKLVQHMGLEAALSQLAFWISALQDTPNSFELRLPEAHLKSGQGERHARLCLRRLAEFPPGAA